MEERKRKRRRRALPLILSFICGVLFLSQCLMAGGFFWMKNRLGHSWQMSVQIDEIQANIRLQNNEKFLRWLIDEGHFREYSTMDEARRGYKEFGDEMKIRRDRENYKKEILRLLKERAQPV